MEARNAEGNGCSCKTTATEVEYLKNDLTYLSHQVYRLLLALRVPACTCDVCGTRNVEQNELILRTSTDPVSAHSEGLQNGSFHDSDSPDIDSQQTANSVTGTAIDEAEVRLNTGASLSGSPMVVSGDGEAHKDPWSRVDHQYSSVPSVQAAVDAVLQQTARKVTPQGRFGRSPGRKSKYCTAAEKAAVANYASVHGATAAARKFNIPPAIASYYHRKIFNKNLPKGRRPIFSEMNGSQSEQRSNGTSPAMDWSLLDGSSDSTNPLPTMVPSVSASASPFALEIDPDSKNEPDISGGANGVSRYPATLGILKGCLDESPETPPSLPDSVLSAQKDPSLIPYKGRGRPKLIGDDLDAELLNFLVTLSRERQERLTADRVLSLATGFIRQKSPGLLADDGGSVQLRPTWAMRLVMRVNRVARAERHALHPSTLSIESVGVRPAPSFVPIAPKPSPTC